MDQIGPLKFDHVAILSCGFAAFAIFSISHLFNPLGDDPQCVCVCVRVSKLVAGSETIREETLYFGIPRH